MNDSILLIGKPHSSKTVFLSQFYSRLQKKRSRLKLYKPVTDLSPISIARDALANGREPQPTPSETSSNFFLPIEMGDKQIDLLCPEYGGEQVINIIETREINENWKNAIHSSQSWILFIRLNSVNQHTDISDVTYGEEANVKTTPEEYQMSDQSFFIELLQIILYHKNYDYHFLNDKLRLTVVLTCWDEMTNPEELPVNKFKTQLPLLHNFINTNWSDTNWKVVGLSAQGFALDTEERKEKYQIEGPEQFGYLIQADGVETKDITQLIELALT
jgi:hypothetical protein